MEGTSATWTGHAGASAIAARGWLPPEPRPAAALAASRGGRGDADAPPPPLEHEVPVKGPAVMPGMWISTIPNRSRSDHPNGSLTMTPYWTIGVGARLLRRFAHIRPPLASTSQAPLWSLDGAREAWIPQLHAAQETEGPRRGLRSHACQHLGGRLSLRADPRQCTARMRSEHATEPPHCTRAHPSESCCQICLENCRSFQTRVGATPRRISAPRRHPCRRGRLRFRMRDQRWDTHPHQNPTAPRRRHTPPPQHQNNLRPRVRRRQVYATTPRGRPRLRLNLGTRSHPCRKTSVLTQCSWHSANWLALHHRLSWMVEGSSGAYA